MATEKKHILEVDTGDSVKTIKELKSEISNLKTELDNCAVGSEEAKKKSQELLKAQADLTAAMKGAVGNNKKLDESYNGLVAQMSKLKTEWRATTDEAKRAQLGEQINNLNDKLKEMDASVGVFSRNVGDYKDAFTALGGEGASAIVSGMNNIKNGLGALKSSAGWIGLIVGIVMSIINVIKSNEEAINKLKKAIAPFEGIINAINDSVGNLIMLLVDKLVGALGKIGTLVENIISKIGDWAGDLGLEGVAAACTTIVDKMTEAQEIGEKTVDNAKRQREIAVANAKSEAELVSLRAKFAESVEGSVEQMELAQKIDEEQQKVYQRNVELAQKEYDLIKQKNAQSPSSTEDLEKENEALVKLIEAQGQLKNQVSELSEVKKRAAEEAARQAEATAEAERKAEEKKNEDIKKLIGDLEKWKSNQSEEGKLAALKAEYDKELELLGDNLEAKKLLEEKYQKDIEAIKKEYTDKQKAEDEKRKEEDIAAFEEKYAHLEESIIAINGFSSTLDGNLAAIGDLMSNLMAASTDLAKNIQSGEKGWTKYGAMATAALSSAAVLTSALAAQQDANTKEGFEKQKNLQIASATMNMLAGVVAAWTSSMALPAPASFILGGIQTAATTALGIAQIAQIKKQKLDDGGSSSANVSTSALQSIAAPVQYTSDVQGASTEVEVPDTRVYVVESDITSTQQKVNTAESESRF